MFRLMLLGTSCGIFMSAQDSPRSMDRVRLYMASLHWSLRWLDLWVEPILDGWANQNQRPFANYYGVNFVLYELSTPFLNVHWMLDKLGMTGSNLQLYNGIALMSTFFGCRLVWGSYQTWLLTRDMITAWRSGPVPNLLFAVYLLSNTTLTCLNFWWFGKMISAMKKRFEPKKIEDSWGNELPAKLSDHMCW